MKKNYYPPQLTVFDLSLENPILALSGNGDAPGFGDFNPGGGEGGFFDWAAPTPNMFGF